MAGPSSDTAQFKGTEQHRGAGASLASPLPEPLSLPALGPALDQESFAQLLWCKGTSRFMYPNFYLLFSH